MGWDKEDATERGTDKLEWPEGQLFALQVTEGLSCGREWSSAGSGCTVGSHPSNDLVIDDPRVSRFHFELSVAEDGVWLKDLGSRNGTAVDGIRSKFVFVRHSSLIRVGNTSIRCSYANDRAPIKLSTSSRFGRLLGGSVPMRRAFHVLEVAAQSSSTVLIEGETGTGKDLAAEAIHQASSRAREPLAVVDCGAMPANLMESELFGHEKGAFTGAQTQRKGVFESATGGTVFLDEIGELSLDLQPKLLRVLEQRAIQRVGGTERIPVDVRILAATNRDLKEQVNEGQFRADLYFRLAVLHLRMPALRERPEDIPVIARSILGQIGEDAAAVEKLLTPEFVSMLRRGAWPGNVRELRNFLEQCVMLDEAVALADKPSPSQAMEFVRGASYGAQRRRYLDQFEKQYLGWLLEGHQGNLTSAAAEADLTRVHFYKLRKKHGL